MLPHVYFSDESDFKMQLSKNFRAFSVSTAVLTGSLLATTIAVTPNSVKAAPEAYEINEATLSGDQRNTDFINRLGARKLANSLRGGGYVVYVRHAKTFKDWEIKSVRR